ncbi:PP2C family protein-serine/threonine phosphatase [Krasilnikovia sp. M28-CT-15]|uniref:PP2C family protein-serine/threonine phosphatase n=1 Tax=Krasilnikovia sp. M28-CT-15 TaxID=3373540 RepID=UPI0038764520
MEMTEEPAWLQVLSTVLMRAHLWQADQIAETLDASMTGLGITPTIYLVDHEQQALHALTPPDQPPFAPVPVDSSVAGRAYAQIRCLPAGDFEHPRLWVPMIDGTTRLGVIDFLLPAGRDPASPVLQQRCGLLAGLIGHLITTTVPRGDHLLQARRTRPMSIASELLWQLLQPLTIACDRVAVSAILQPCYDVGGDGYDYAIDANLARLSILDGVGKGLRAGLATAVALAALRAARRDGQDLAGQARTADTALGEEFTDARFVTAVLAELDMDTGVLQVLNAGHPAPLLLRAGRVVGELDGGRRTPLGVTEPHMQPAEHRLEPGDQILMYTDGITEARDATGELFGVDRLADLAVQHAATGLPAPEIVRRLSHAVIEHQHGPPADDATLLLAEWSPDAAHRTNPLNS